MRHVTSSSNCFSENSSVLDSFFTATFQFLRTPYLYISEFSPTFGSTEPKPNISKVNILKATKRIAYHVNLSEPAPANQSREIICNMF
jgi:hypothetical protein